MGCGVRDLSMKMIAHTATSDSMASCHLVGMGHCPKLRFKWQNSREETGTQGELELPTLPWLEGDRPLDTIPVSCSDCLERYLHMRILREEYTREHGW